MRIFCPRAAQHQELDLVYRVSIEPVCCRASNELPERIEAMPPGTPDPGFIRDITPRHIWLVWTVKAIVPTTETLSFELLVTVLISNVILRVRAGEYGDDENSRETPNRVANQESLQPFASLKHSIASQNLINHPDLRHFGTKFEPDSSMPEHAIEALRIGYFRPFLG
mmetsp:Transcript_20376/g.32833  ORF Transcript_20376/g.32833 Transcript_20376/m.32833 type:complete len:168 (+) Transcript_20376:1592-2095(+)